MDQYDPFELGVNPFGARAGDEEQEAADTGGSSSSGATATQLGVGAVPTVVLTEVQRERIAENKRCATQKKEASKRSNLLKRKTALEKKLAREGVGALSGAQLDVLRGVSSITDTKVDMNLDGECTTRNSVQKSSEATGDCRVAEEKPTLKRLRPTSAGKDEELDHWLTLSVGERARKLARSLEVREVTRSQVRLTAGSGEPVVEAAASDPVTAHRPARPVWGSAWRR